MLLYRYDRGESCKSISYSTDPFSGKISGEGSPKTIISASPVTMLHGNNYVYDMESGVFYLYNETALKESVCAEAILVPQCTSGISIYDRNSGEKKEITHVDRGGRLYVTFDFNNDNRGNIWARVFTLDDSYRHVETEGYVIYKNFRNNFSNLEFTDSSMKTVLTDGRIDNAKVEKVKTGQAVQAPSFRAVQVQQRTQSKAGNTKPDVSDYIESPKSTSTSQEGESYDFNRCWTFNASPSNRGYMHDIATNGPKVVTNISGFPPAVNYVNAGSFEGESQGLWEYDYSLKYKGGLGDLTKIYKDYNMNTRTIYANTKNNIERYNRFKLAYPDDILSRGYMHIFMTRPDLNYFSGSTYNIRSEMSNDPFLTYMRRKNLSLVKQLVELNGDNHQFMMMLSNKAKGFSLTDDGINHDTYGKSRNGYSVAYGRRRDSELGGSLNITYKDNRDFDILNLHKLWVDYIINVFSGKWTPKKKYIQNKIIDYATAIYVIVTAEDFETVLFWTKYYGVFPVSLPFSAISWDGDRSTVSAPDLQITYAYSWKEDLNPVALSELNMNCFKRGIPKSAKYVPTYSKTLAAVDNTWVGPPFIEIVKYPNDRLDLTNGAGVAIKLRFST